MKTLLKTVVIILLASILSFSTSFAKEISLKFDWDANIEPEMAGYALFQRQEGQQYDYTKPIDPVCTIVDGKCWVNPTTKNNEFPHKFDSPDGQNILWHWVARARDTDGNWSADSNEVSFQVNLTPLPTTTDFVGVYNDTTKTIDFTWTQKDPERINSWKLYQGTILGGAKTQVLAIPWNGTDSTISASLPSDTLAPGQDYYFTLVSFGDFDLYSSDSNEVKIDRTGPATVIQLRITLE